MTRHVDTIDSYRTGEVVLTELPPEELADVKAMMIAKATEFCRNLPPSQPLSRK